MSVMVLLKQVLIGGRWVGDWGELYPVFSNFTNLLIHTPSNNDDNSNDDDLSGVADITCR